MTKREKKLGGTNVLAISPQKLVVRDDLPRIREVLTKVGFECFLCPWEEMKKTGTAGPRCAVLPLRRSQGL